MCIRNANFFAISFLFRKYCVNCLKIWTEHGDKLVNNSDEWFCFLCRREAKQLLQAHDNWEQKVFNFGVNLKSNHALLLFFLSRC
jgi:hypothetical protein